MLRDILKNSTNFLQFDKACENLLKGEPKKYSLLTDSILERIQFEYIRISGEIENSKKDNKPREPTKEEKPII